MWDAQCFDLSLWFQSFGIVWDQFENGCCLSGLALLIGLMIERLPGTLLSNRFLGSSSSVLAPTLAPCVKVQDCCATIPNG